MSIGMTRRSMVEAAAGVAAFMAGLAAACGPARQQGAGLKGPVSLTLWDREEASYQPFMEKWLPGFNAKHPQIQLAYEPRPPQWGEKLTTAIVAGTPPDLAAVFGPWFRSLQQEKQVLALDKYIRASKFDGQDFLQGQFKGMHWQGQQIAIPQYVNTNAVYYNRDHFNRAGVPLPKDDWTHDQFLDAARRLTRGALPVREVWGVTTNWGSITLRIVSLLWGQCGNYNPPDNPDVFTFNTPQNVKAFQWVHDLPWRHRISAVTNADRGGVGGPDALFATGTVAMLLEGTHLLATWKTKAQTDWDVAALPKGPCGRGERTAMDGYIVPAGVKTPDASWTAMVGITDREANMLRTDIVGFVPARKSTFDHWIKSIPGKNLRSAAPSDALRPDPASLWPKAAEVNRALGPIWQALFNKNEITVPDALKQAHEAIVGVLGASAVK